MPTTMLGRDVSFDGYLDLYYQMDLGRPSHSEPVNGRWYDVTHDAYQVAAAQFDFVKATSEKSRLGIRHAV